MVSIDSYRFLLEHNVCFFVPTSSKRRPTIEVTEAAGIEVEIADEWGFATYCVEKIVNTPKYPMLATLPVGFGYREDRPFSLEKVLKREAEVPIIYPPCGFFTGRFAKGTVLVLSDSSRPHVMWQPLSAVRHQTFNIQLKPVAYHKKDISQQITETSLWDPQCQMEMRLCEKPFCQGRSRAVDAWPAHRILEKDTWFDFLLPTSIE